MTRATQAFAALVAALALAGCGKDEGEPIPADHADGLIRGLRTAKNQARDGACNTLLKTTIPTLDRRAQDLPAEVGSDVRATIEDGIAHLRQLAEADCREREQEALPPTSETTTPSEPPSTTEEPPTTEETTRPETTETEPPSTTETEPPPPTEPPTTPPPTAEPPGNGGITTPGQRGLADDDARGRFGGGDR